MPMNEVDQRGGRIPDNIYCVFCTDEAGKLKPYTTVRNGMAAFWVKREDIPIEKAISKSESLMNYMPAWRDNQD